MTEQTFDYKTRFTFHLSHFNGTIATELCTLNFYGAPREFADPNKSLENSWEIVDAFAQITSLFQKYMKGITMDHIQKTLKQDEDNQYLTYNTNIITNENDVTVHKITDNQKYVFKLIDHCASVRTNDKLTDAKEVRVIYEHEIWAHDYYAITPLSIIPIWKDIEQDSKKNAKKGIRTILKDLMLLPKYTSRFTNSKYIPHNTYCVNSFEL